MSGGDILEIIVANELRKGVDQTYIQHIILKDGVTTKCVEYFKKIGNVDYHIIFPRVFFKVNINNRYVINGTINSSILEVIYLDEDYAKCIRELEKVILEFKCDYLNSEVS